MATPFTRSSRRSEGLATRSGPKNNVAVHQAHHHLNNAHNRQQPSNIGRKKRLRDSTEKEDQSLILKKARFAIEITSPSNSQPKPKALVIKPNAEPDVILPQLPALSKNTKSTATQAHPQSAPPQKSTTHHQKVVNGIKHELDRLQPNRANLKEEKRKLRSQEGTRFKSELSAYFPEYDEIIGNEPKEEHFLTVETPIILLDSAKISTQPLRQQIPTNNTIKPYPDPLFGRFYDAQRLDFSFLDRRYKEEGGEDPLEVAYFVEIHRKPERLEKSIRNSDKGRAQHEKDQVIRLLEGLQGHDWLKLMGVSGVTETKKKEFEPAREYFIAGCQSIIEKFRIWREEEKRRKLEREQALADAEAQAEAEAEEEEARKMKGVKMGEDEYLSDGDPPDYSDVDASAARQLQEEAKARSASSHKGHNVKPTVLGTTSDVGVEKEFKSFFRRPHLREAAMGRQRRSGRSVAAWGQPVPEIEQANFDLPEEYRDAETLKLRERAKRRARRISKE